MSSYLRSQPLIPPSNRNLREFLLMVPPFATPYYTTSFKSANISANDFFFCFLSFLSLQEIVKEAGMVKGEG